MSNAYKLKVFDNTLRKSFYVSLIDYTTNQVYYENDGKQVITPLKECVILLPTGFSDINNRPIYENDVISYQETSFTSKKTARVAYENGCFICRQYFSKEMESRISKENLDPDNFTDLLCIAINSTFKPARIIGNAFTFKNSKIKKRTAKKAVTEKIAV